MGLRLVRCVWRRAQTIWSRPSLGVCGCIVHAVERVRM